MKIYDFPKEIQKLAIANQIAQGNKENLSLFIGDDKLQGNFNWDESVEGYDFWHLINCEQIEKALSLLPKKEVIEKDNSLDITSFILGICVGAAIMIGLILIFGLNQPALL